VGHQQLAPAEERRAQDGECEGEGDDRVVAGHGYGVEHDRRCDERQRRNDPRPATPELTGRKRRQNQRRRQDERHLRGEQGYVAYLVGTEEGRRHEGEKVAGGVFDEEVPVGDLPAQDALSGLAVDRQVVR
jgi:hypothetical protein